MISHTKIKKNTGDFRKPMLFSIRKENFYALIVGLVSFWGSLVIAPWHIGGDQIVYQNTYNYIGGLNIVDAITHYQGQIASLEIIHFIYTYFCSTLNIDKLVSMAFANALLGFYSTKAMFKFFHLPGWALLLILSNYYLLSLFFTLERLKFGVIFLVIAIVHFKNIIIRFSSLLLSILSHFSIILLFIIRELAGGGESGVLAQRGNHSLWRRYKILISFFFILLIIYYFEEQIRNKIPAYLLVTSNFEMFVSGSKTFIFFVLSSFVTRSISARHLFIFMPLMLLSIIIEPARINFFSYIFLMYFCYISDDQLRKYLILFLISLYYSFTGLVYLEMLRTSGG
jgi:hypothetical protein